MVLSGDAVDFQHENWLEPEVTTVVFFYSSDDTEEDDL